MKPTYDESSIRALEGLEPVRLRPGMYTRTENPLHIIQEVIDNAVDEAIGGFVTEIVVELDAEDGAVLIRDNGRGIPVGPHPVKKVPVVELVFTALHAGGKFSKTEAESAYRFSGGLHGVGVSVTNALSARLEVEVAREGARWKIVFAGGDVVEPLAKLGKCSASEHGTSVRVWPDAKYFDSPRVPRTELVRLLRTKAVLLPGLKVVFREGATEQVWQFQDGLSDYLSEQLAAADEDMAPVLLCTALGGPTEEGADVAFAFPCQPFRESYANLVNTPQGGTHEGGFREGLFSALRQFMEQHSMLPKGAKLTQEDLVGLVAYLVNARVEDPQFQGQTKDRLLSKGVGQVISGQASHYFATWLNQHLPEARALAERVASRALSRTRAGQKVVRRKGTGAAVLPGKLADCESVDIAINELIIVEGDSAGGGARQARDKTFQAILPIRGKIVNTWEVQPDQLFDNKEVHDLSTALGVDPHLPGQGDLAGLRYGKLLILADADVDGSHIQVLLITLFLRHFPDLVTAGVVQVVQPPLYRIDVPPKGKQPPRKVYVRDDREKSSALRKLEKEGFKPDILKISRFKGLGEMMPAQLWETALDPHARTLVRIVRGEAERELATFKLLMAKSEAAGRREWMRRRGHETEGDV
jgi:topoisomerase-4 subunit B